MRIIDDQKISRNDLQAFVDDQLTQQDHILVEKWLETHPDDMALAGEWKAQKLAIQQAFGQVSDATEMDKKLLESISQHAEGPIHKSPTSTRILPAVAAAIAIFSLGGVFGMWLANQSAINSPGSEYSQHGNQQLASTSDLPLFDKAKVNHVIYTAEQRHKVEVGADEKEHLGRWLGSRLNKPDSLPIPDLTTLGFDLVGGRLVPYEGKPSALLMYGSASGTQLTILVGQLPKNSQQLATTPQFEKEGKLGTLAWRTGTLGYAISAPMDQVDLERVAEHVAL